MDIIDSSRCWQGWDLSQLGQVLLQEPGVVLWVGGWVLGAHGAAWAVWPLGEFSAHSVARAGRVSSC